MSVSHLWSAIKVKHQCFVLWNHTPEPLTQFSSVTVLQEATQDTVSRDLSCFNLEKGRRKIKNGSRRQKEQKKNINNKYLKNSSFLPGNWFLGVHSAGQSEVTVFTDLI